ncbi:MAG: MarR family winged helix-turn-helix transcriptional regulator [Chloroflexi bacterium]|nr:MarR family winged helix-turn-helix transcriptional regulator [Chloroflexota bacterium]
MSLDHNELIQATLCINANFRAVCRQLTQFYNGFLEPTGLQNTQFTMLVTIALMKWGTIMQLAENLQMDQTTLTRGVERLRQQGWVESVPDKEDRRVKHIVLTEAGEKLLKEAFPLWQQAQLAVQDALGAEDAEILLRLLDKVTQVAHED